MPDKQPFISIIIPAYNEECYIAACLDSVLDSDYDQERMEVLIVDGASTDKTAQIVREYMQNHTSIRLLSNIKRIAPVAMNIGINESSGEYIIRLDAHSAFSANYFSKLVIYIEKLRADNVGGIAITDVKNKTKISNAIKRVLAHSFGVGNSDFRTGVDSIKEVDTVPFGCFRRDVFERFGMYDERLIRNQDIELNKRIKTAGGKIYLIPDVYFTYFSRESYVELFKNSYSNGLWNVLTVYYTNSIRSLNLRHFAPLLYLLSIITPIIASVVWESLKLVSFVSFAVHTGLIAYFSFKESDTDASPLHLFFAFITLHYSYGLGSLAGVFKVLKIKLLNGE
jgi:glycosyltransferase involved in cell wall biosynthesis